MADFDAKKATFRDRFARSRENASKPFGGDDIPPSTYTGKVKSYERGVSKSSGRNQTKIEIVIVDGEQKGLVARQYQSLEPTNDGRDIGLDITLRAFGFFGYEVPADASSLEDLDPILKAITDSAPTVQFKYTMKGDFPNIELLRLIDDGGASEATDAEGESDQASASPSASGFEDADHERLVEFGLAQGVEGITDGMSKAEVVEQFNGAVFWTKDCTVADLKGTDAEGQDPADGIEPTDAEWILEQGVTVENVIRPKPKAKTPVKKSVVKKGKK